MTRKFRRPSLLLSLALLAVLVAPLSVSAAPPEPFKPLFRHGSPPFKAPAAAAATWQVVGTGLDNPRGLAFGPDGGLYVAEAGTGGTDCFPTPFGDYNCVGATGAITRIDLRRGSQQRVAQGLPSGTSTGDPKEPVDSFAIGPVDISFQGRGNGYVIVGLGADPRLRKDWGSTALGLGHLVRMLPNGSWQNVSDIAGYEVPANPDGGEIDSDPYALLALPSAKVIIADAGGNDLLQYNTDTGKTSTLAVFPSRKDVPVELACEPPFPLPPTFDMEAVPTSVILGPNGDYYVAQLTGAPFPVGGADIYRVPAGGGTPQAVAGGFTNIIDIAFAPDGSLYVLEITKNGLLNAELCGQPPVGALIRVAPDGTRTEVASDGLIAPGGLAIDRDGSVYVSNMSVFAGTGEVVKVVSAQASSAATDLTTTARTLSR